MSEQANEARTTADLPDSAELVKALARDGGFPLVGITPAVQSAWQAEYHRWLELGYQGEMGYLERNVDLRGDPALLVPGARSIIALGTPYKTKESTGRISNYAWGDDYHRLIGRRLKSLWDGLLVAFPGIEGRTFVDTAPILEREVAARAGLGWIGKHTLLINKRYGSYVFLAEIITTLTLPPDLPGSAHCGSCTRCLDACPTDAFPQPGVLDASRCISYLTIEHRGPIEPALGSQLGGWVYGCDICQQVCPWNRKAPGTLELSLQPRESWESLSLVELATLGIDAYQARTTGSAMKRAKRSGLRRNAILALGAELKAGGSPSLRTTLEALLDDEDELVRVTAKQALDMVAGAAKR